MHRSRLDSHYERANENADGKIIQPTGKTAKLEFCTVATWKNGEIVEERLFYDVVGFMKQLGLSK